MDKIGAFRFTIKGWSVTIVSAVLVGASVLDGVVTTLSLGMSLSFFVISFFRLEVEQVRLSKVFGARAQELERAILLLERSPIQKRRTPSPNIAHQITKASYKRTVAAKRRTWWSHNVKDDWRDGRAAHRWFYVILLVIILLTMLRSLLLNGALVLYVYGGRSIEFVFQSVDAFLLAS